MEHSLILGKTVGADWSCTLPIYRLWLSSMHFPNAPVSQKGVDIRARKTSNQYQQYIVWSGQYTLSWITARADVWSLYSKYNHTTFWVLSVLGQQTLSQICSLNVLRRRSGGKAGIDLVFPRGKAGCTQALRACKAVAWDLKKVRPATARQNWGIPSKPKTGNYSVRPAR